MAVTAVEQLTLGRYNHITPLNGSTLACIADLYDGLRGICLVEERTGR